MIDQGLNGGVERSVWALLGRKDFLPFLSRQSTSLMKLLGELRLEM